MAEHNKEGKCVIPVLAILILKCKKDCHERMIFSSQFSSFKGTVPRDFLLQVFFMNQFPPSPWVYHQDRSVELFRKFADIRSSRCTAGVVDTLLHLQISQLKVHYRCRWHAPSLVHISVNIKKKLKWPRRLAGEDDSWKKPGAKNLVTLSL